MGTKMSYNTENYIFFWKNGTVFTNFHLCEFEYDGHTFYSSEQAFMYEKAKAFDHTAIPAILSSRRPDHVKRLGRKIKNYKDREWDKLRYDAMVNVLRAKFSNEDLKKTLLATGDKILVEASPFDKIWGIGLDPKQAKRTPPEHWHGRNLLGQALMQVRDELRGE